MKLYNSCVYTVVDEDTLLGADRGDHPSSPVPKGRKWSSVKGWLQLAKDRGESVPIVLADAKHVHRWLGWGILAEVEIQPVADPPSETRYRFQSLRPPFRQLRSDFRCFSRTAR